MSVTRHLRLFGLLAGAIALLTGCAGEFGLELCTSSAHCPTGTQCSAGFCAEVPVFEVDMEIVPPPSADHLPFTVNGVDLGETNALVVTVPEPSMVTLQQPGPEPTGASAVVPVRVRIRPMPGASGDHPASSAPIEVDVPVDDTVSPAAPGKVEVHLSPGTLDAATGELVKRRYQLISSPIDGSCCPEGEPCTAPFVSKGSNGDGITFASGSTWTLELPADPVRVSGKVVVSEGAWTPIEGLQVQLFDPADPDVFSTTGTTDADGAFCVTVQRPATGQSREMTVRLGPGEARPTVEVAGATIESMGKVDLGIVPIGAHGTPLPVVVTVEDGNGNPVPGTRLTAEGQVDPAGQFTARASTDDQGRGRVDLLKGTYVFRAEPPEGSPWGLSVLEAVDVQPVSGGGTRAPLQIVLPRRPRIMGRVMTPSPGDGDPEPLADVVVRVVPDPILGIAATAPQGRPIEGHTDADGSFLIPVDPGDYRLDFRPPAISELPWSVGWTEASISGDRDMGDIVLETSSELVGTVRGVVPDDPTTTQVEGPIDLPETRVDIFGQAPDGERILIHSARTDEAGEYRVILPSNLTEE